MKQILGTTKIKVINKPEKITQDKGEKEENHDDICSPSSGGEKSLQFTIKLFLTKRYKGDKKLAFNRFSKNKP